MTELGVATAATSPPPSVWQAWLTWRRFLVAGTLGPLGADSQKHTMLKPEAQWEYDRGQGLSGPQVYAASLNRTRLYRHMVDLFERYDLLVLPTAQVWPLAAEWTWPREVAGRPVDTYHRWMEVVIHATLAGPPAMNVSVGFSDEGLPMGMQLIGPPLAVGSVLTLVNSIGFAISIVSIQLFVMLAQRHELATLLPWLGLGPLLGVWALRPLWRR